MVPLARGAGGGAAPRRQGARGCHGRPRLGGVSERLTRDSEGTVWRLAGVAGAGGAAQARARVAEEGRERTAGLRAMQARGHSDGRGGSAAWGRTRGGAAARAELGERFSDSENGFFIFGLPNRLSQIVYSFGKLVSKSFQKFPKVFLCKNFHFAGESS